MRLHIDWVLLPFLVATMAALLFLLRRTRLGPFLRERIADRPRRRLFIASVSFFLTFATVRGMVFCIVHHIPPFHYVIMEGRHIHHLVFGILILLLVGYGWLCEVGNGSDSSSILAGSLMSLLYGLGAALTLDEFALWLNLKDVYFVREGRSSFDAIILFGSLLAMHLGCAAILIFRQRQEWEPPESSLRGKTGYATCFRLERRQLLGFIDRVIPMPSLKLLHPRQRTWEGPTPAARATHLRFFLNRQGTILQKTRKQCAIYLQGAVVADETLSFELIHKFTYPGAGGAHHLRQG